MKLAAFRREDEPDGTRRTGLVVGDGPSWWLHPFPEGTDLVELLAAEATDREAAADAALDRAGVTAEGVLAVVDAAMVRALRHVSVEQGVDPRGLALVAFGGAGPLHACGLAEALGITTVIVPPRAGVFSAVGVLCSPRQREIVRSWAHPLDPDGLDDALAALGVGGTRLHEDGLVCGPLGGTVCFAGRGPGEVLVGDAKLVGISQRRTRAGARFQCAVPVYWDPAPLATLLSSRPDAQALAAVGTGLGDAVERDDLVDALVTALG